MLFVTRALSVWDTPIAIAWHVGLLHSEWNRVQKVDYHRKSRRGPPASSASSPTNVTWITDVLLKRRFIAVTADFNILDLRIITTNGANFWDNKVINLQSFVFYADFDARTKEITRMWAIAQRAPSHGGMWTTCNTWSLRPSQVLNPDGISIGSAVFAGLTSVTDRQTGRQTDHATRALTIDHIYVCSTAMWSKN